jgi:cephalosporin-C deacetylase-like acetyl esterase
MFDYKEDTLSGFEVMTTISKDGLSICNVKYESPFKCDVTACLFIPDNHGPLPAVIFIEPSPGIRKSYYDEAQTLAKKGYITLFIEAKFLRGFGQPDVMGKKEFTKTIEEWADIQKYIQTVMDIRRGVTLLSKLMIVDDKRIAFIGHGFGAAWGAILSGIDNRIKAFILISGYGKASEWQLTSGHPIAALIRSFLPLERFEYFISSLKKVDAIHFIKNAVPASILFQFAENDENIDRDQALSFYTSASSPKKILWYDTDHLFTTCEIAIIDRHEWLNNQFAAQNDTISKESTKN